MPAVAAEMLASKNPLTGEIVGEVPVTSASEIPAVVAKARAASKSWAAMSAQERADIIRPASKRFEEEAERIGKQLTLEMGKIYREALGEVQYVGTSIPETLIEIVEAVQPMVHKNETTVSTIYRDPLGVAACITPWNFPIAMPHSQVLPALVAGNAVILKPSEETPLTAQAYADILNEFLPEGVLQVVHGADDQGKALVLADIDLIVFTGSREVGKHILAAASADLKRVILELGGKDPLVVLDGADIDAAAEYATHNSFRNAGQVCVATERIYVTEKIAEPFMKAFVERVEKLRIGDGLDESTDIGPMIHDRQRAHVLAQLDRAKAQGAHVACGSDEHRDGFVNPTILAGVTHEMEIANEETFGPVATVTVVKDDEQAIELANDTPFGLGASVFGPKDRAYEIGRASCRERV